MNNEYTRKAQQQHNNIKRTSTCLILLLILLIPGTYYGRPPHVHVLRVGLALSDAVLGRLFIMTAYHDCGVPGISKQHAKKTEMQIDRILVCMDATRSMRSDDVSCVMETETMTSEYVPTVQGVVRRQSETAEGEARVRQQSETAEWMCPPSVGHGPRVYPPIDRPRGRHAPSR